MNPRVDAYIEEATKWKKEFQKLRDIALETGLTEDLKWGHPCYTLNGTNIVLIHGFKDYCAYLFFKGALLSDPDGILIRQTENVQSARQVRFTSATDVTRLRQVLKAYIFEAIEVEKAGLKVKMKKTRDYPVPEEFQKKLDSNARLKTAFDALTPGRQRAYLFYFASAKQSRTRESRIKDNMSKILAGKGLDD